YKPGCFGKVGSQIQEERLSSRLPSWKLAFWTSPPPSISSPPLLDAPGFQFLDPFDGDSEDPRGPPASSFSDCPPGDVSGTVPLRGLGCGSPGQVRVGDPLSSKAPDLLPKAAGWGPHSLEADDVDMQPAEASSPEARGRAARRSGSPEDWGMTEDRWPGAAGPVLPAAGPPEPGRHAQGRARAARPPPRLGSEKDKGPKLPLSKRKLELLLAEPEKNKRKRQYAA
uniref:Uncharacterized LOC109490767 n=1 Tax=Ailuropoda melanoleuca TaxID=9646 RepID=A0A7N5JD92_AILME